MSKLFKSLLSAVSIFAPSFVFAHASLEVKEAKTGSTYSSAVIIPHGCSSESTHTVRVKIPEGFHSVKPQPKAGWTLEIIKGKYAKTYLNHGTQVTEGAKEIIWSKGLLPDDQFDSFNFRGSLDAGLTADKLYFETTQFCSNDKSVSWSDINVPNAKFPAPALTLIKSEVAMKIGDLTITTPWLRATPEGAKAAGGFLKITNTGKTDDVLLSSSVPFAGRTEVHDMAMEHGVMKMRHLPKGLVIKAGETVELKPGSFHLMFFDLNAPLKANEAFKIKLNFEKAGSIEVNFPVLPMGSTGAQAKEGGHHAH